MKVVWLMRDYGMNGVVAHEPGVMETIDSEADQIGTKARIRLSQVRSSGRYSEGNSKIEVEHRIPGDKYDEIDALVVLVDEDTTRPDGSFSPGDALAIEFGHVHNYTGEYIPGKYIVTGAAGLA